MIRLAASAIAIVLTGVPSTSAFSTSKMSARLLTTKLHYNSPEYDPVTHQRALDCANNFGLCGIDELLDLSEELDEYLGCFVDGSPEECEKEIDQRQELSEALLVQGEMIEHDMYVQEGNIFPANNQMVDNRWEGFAP